MLNYDPLPWIENQPDTPFAIDAKCLIGQLTDDMDQFKRSSTFHSKLQLIKQHRLSDGSFESKYGGGVGSVLWTADAINYLSLMNDPQDHQWIVEAIMWLDGRRQSNGSWAENQEIPWKRVWYKSAAGRLWITAATLQSLKTASEHWPIIHVMVQEGLKHLQDSFETLGKLLESGAPPDVYHFFGFDTFSLSVCLETFHSYQKEIPLTQQLIQFFQQQQFANGSWADSIDMTQCTTHGLLLLGESPYAPTVAKSVAYLVHKQNKDGSWSHSSAESGDWTLTAYTTRLFLQLARQTSGSLFRRGQPLIKQC